MANEVMDLAAWTIETACAAGADDVRARVEIEQSVETGCEGGRPTVREATSRRVDVEIFVDGRYSSQSTTDLRRETLKTFLTYAVAGTRLLARDPARSLPGSRRYGERSTADLKLVDTGYGRFTPDARHALTRACEAAALAAGGDRVVSVTSREQDSYSEVLLAASDGFVGEHRATTYALLAQLALQDSADRRSTSWGYGVAADPGGLPAPDELGRETAARARALLGAEPIPAETLPVVIENRVAGQLLSGFLQALSGGSIARRASFLAAMRGRRVGSPAFTLIDDPFIPGAIGSRHFDADGLAAKTRVMVEGGVLREFYVDWYAGRRLGWEPTTGSPSNLVLPPGPRPVEAIMRDLGRGLLVTGFTTGRSNPASGEFTLGVVGRLFEDGEPGRGVARMSLSDNHLTLWERLTETANDPWTSSRMRLPSLVLDPVTIVPE